MDKNSKIAMVTGAGSGIGKAVADRAVPRWLACGSGRVGAKGHFSIPLPLVGTKPYWWSRRTSPNPKRKKPLCPNHRKVWAFGSAFQQCGGQRPGQTL